MSRRLKLTLIGITLISGITIVVGYNSWFGAGGSIPEDTFTRGLVAYYSFDEGTGNIAYDISGNGNNCTIYGAKWTKGKYGSALQFDGVDDYVDIPDSTDFTFDATTSFTIEVWMKTSYVGYGAIVSNYSGTTEFFRVYTDANGIGFDFRDANGNFVDVNPSGTGSWKYLNGGWHHIVAKRDVSTGKAYVFVDAKLIKSVDDITNTVIDSDSNLRIGRNVNGIYPFHGTIDEVRIYNRVLSPEEIRYHYNRGRPVAHWRFDEGSGTTTYDSSGNEYHGILHE